MKGGDCLATIKFINGGKHGTYRTMASVKRVISYIVQEMKTRENLKGSIYCLPESAYDDFVTTKAMYGKLPGTLNENEESKFREAVHFTQNFKKGEIEPEKARAIADELVKCPIFKGFQIIYATHIDREHIHTHFVINTVNFDTGKRWRISKYDLATLKNLSDDLCRQNNLSVIPKKENSILTARQKKVMSSGEYRARKQGRSWKAETLHAGLECKKVAKDREEFILLMEKFGYKLRWEENRRDITFTAPGGKKINSDKLGVKEKNYYPLTKEALEKQFSLNRQVKKNNYKDIGFIQQDFRKELLKFAEQVAKKNSYKNYPFQQQWHSGEGKLEGEALKEKINELAKGQGIDWERE